MSNEPTSIDWARLAAYIDGEGTIFIAPANRRRGGTRTSYILCVAVSNTDARLPLWLKSTFGGCITKALYGKRKKFLFNWRVSCNKAKMALSGTLPYLVIKKDQAEVALAFAALVSPKGYHNRHNPESSHSIENKERLMQQLSEMKDHPVQQLVM